MTNILLLPRIDGANTSFVVTQNADWVDQIPFAAPNNIGTIVLVACAFTVGSNAITVSSSANLGPGMPIAQIPGIPQGAFVGTITSPTAITMVDLHGNPLNAIGTNAYATMTFLPQPLDITGINFIASLRAASGNNAQVFLTAQTRDGSMINNGTTGVLQFNVKQEAMAQVPVGQYIVDILAYDATTSINLLPMPASITVNSGAADPTLAM